MRIPFVFLVSFILVFSVISISLIPQTTKMVSALDLQTWGEQEITSGSRHKDFLDILKLHNGDLIIAYGNLSGHSGSGRVECIISNNNGTSWSTPIFIHGANTSKVADCSLGQTINHTVVVTYRNDEIGTAGYSVSYDNGSSWTFMGNVNGGVGNVFAVTGIKHINGVIYGACHGGDATNESLRFYNTTSQSWNLVSYIDESLSPLGNLNEWDFIPLNDTYWICVSRVGTGSGHTYQFYTNNAGLTWTGFTDIYSQVGEFHDPNMHWLNYDQDIIILHGRKYTPTEYTSFYLSNDSGSTWTNYTVIDTATDCGYTGFAEYNGSQKGLLCWYHGTTATAQISTIWVADNDTYPGDPGGEYNPSVINEMGYSGQYGFLNESVMVGDFYVNWTWDTNGTPSYHWINISNSSSFSTLYRNYNVTHNETNVYGNYVNYTIDDVVASTSKRYIHIRSFYE